MSQHNNNNNKPKVHLNFHDDSHDGLEEGSARRPVKSVVADLLLDEGKIHNVVDLDAVAAQGQVIDAI